MDVATLANGRKVPALGFGTLAVQPDREHSDSNAALTAEVVRQAFEVGYRHIDSAQSYGTERGVGRAIAESVLPRDDLFIATKLANPNHAPDDVARSFEQSLDYLGLDYLDLFMIHWPLPTLYDGDYVSTWRAVTRLLDDGRLRSAGVSNFQPAHLDRLVEETGVAPAVNQFELHPYFRNSVARAASEQHGIAVAAHSPLGHNREPLSDPTIGSIAARLEKSPAQVILRWHLQHGDIAIPKSTKADRMRENFAVFDFTLPDEDVAAIDALDRGPDGRVGPDPDTYAG